ncbi:hypothetical protein B0H63DRAFT_203851 [Podospora didyma]|uniref:Uncharacterized protein n=1 Tax=Podospora didyma TaxID=330526 RepID=A0AAE0NH10_9PEZI|nr:hypothetical protein B0H63DRAFT_203851 [Podospora didyma]
MSPTPPGHYWVCWGGRRCRSEPMLSYLSPFCNAGRFPGLAPFLLLPELRKKTEYCWAAEATAGRICGELEIFWISLKSDCCRARSGSGHPRCCCCTNPPLQSQLPIFFLFVISITGREAVTYWTEPRHDSSVCSEKWRERCVNAPRLTLKGPGPGLKLSYPRIATTMGGASLMAVEIDSFLKSRRHSGRQWKPRLDEVNGRHKVTDNSFSIQIHEEILPKHVSTTLNQRWSPS